MPPYSCDLNWSMMLCSIHAVNIMISDNTADGRVEDMDGMIE
jgi:hypothetical protein